ncbi:AAA family ATPase [Actinomadura meridiana]
MRIDRLDLIAYGAFDGYSLEGLGAPGVHLVHGPNEAGKSTALSALDQLLYGIDHGTPYAYLHGGQTRLGARLSAPDGVALEIVRRKKRRDALVDGDGTPIGQEELVPFLGGIDRDTFTTEFALNSAELRKGGALLASGEGDMAQLLAAARSGMRLEAVLKQIDSRQRLLYLPRGRTNPKINAALKRLKEARQDARDAMLRPEQYWEAEQAVTEAADNLVATEKELKDKRALRAAKQQLLDMFPTLDEQRDLEAHIEEITQQGPCAPDDIREQLGDLLTKHSNHDAVRSKNSPLVADVDQQLADIGDDGSLLPHAAAIERLSKDITAILDEVTRRDESSEKAARTRGDALSRLHTVHPRATLDEQGRYRFPAALRTLGQRLRDEGHKHHDALAHARDAVKGHRTKRERLAERLGSFPVTEDVTHLRNAHATAPRDLPEKLAEKQAEEKKRTRRFHRALNRLELPELTPSDVLELRLPERGRVTEVESDVRDLDQRLRDRATELDQAQRQLGEHRRELARLVTDDSPPTREELRIQRARRDELITRFRDDPSVQGSLQEAVRRADTIVDLMLRHVEEVNRRAELEREITEGESTVPALQSMVEDAQTDLAQARLSWDALWKDYPATAPEPGRGTGVLDDVDRLRTDAQDLEDIHVDLHELRDRLATCTARLKELLRLDDALPFAEMLNMAGVRLDEHADVDARRTAARRDLDNAETELADAATDEADAEQAVTDHRKQWEQFLRNAGLPADRDLDTALTDLDTLMRVAGEVDVATVIEDGVRQAEQRISDFEHLLRETFRSCGRGAPVSTADWRQAAETLAADLRKQQDDDRKRQGLLDHRSKLVQQVDDAELELDEIEGRLRDFRARLGVTSNDAMEQAVDRARDLRETSTALAKIQRALPSGTKLTRLRQQAAETSADELGSELVELGRQIEDLEETKDDWLERRTTRRDALGRLNGGGDAALAAADSAAICAELAEDAEEFLRLEAARIAILTCMNEYRDSDQEPVLVQASQVFSKLSLGRYTGLELSDEERPSVRAKTSTGSLLAPTSLSEGAQDQLYLALRLATLERHAAAGHTLPIAVDDIFMTFDEPRTEAALRVLDTMADRFQVIVFTHHEQVVRSASKELPEGRCHVHHLPSPPE